MLTIRERTHFDIGEVEENVCNSQSYHQELSFNIFIAKRD
jgi:hypothetical protein